MILSRLYRFTRFLLIIFSCFFFSCQSVSYLQIEVLEPAEITLPGEVETFGIVDKSQMYSPDTSLAERTDNLPDPERYTDLKMIAQASIIGLTDVLDSSPRFEYNILDDSILKVNHFAEYLTPEEWERMQLFCFDSLVDALIVLKGVDAHDAVTLEYDDAGELFYLYRILIQQKWRIYDPNQKVIIDDYDLLDTTYHFSDMSFFEMLFVQYRPDREQMVPDAAFWAGQEYGYRIAPVWAEETRKYYSWNAPSSRIALQYLRSGRWEDAIGAWNTETSNPNRKIAARACYNMALGSEVFDNLDMAEIWLQKSLEIRPSNAAENYLMIIRQRIEERSKLSPQMNP